MKKLTVGILALAMALPVTTLMAQTAPENPPSPSEHPEVSVTVPARPGQRRMEPIPAVEGQGVSLSLRDAIALALANNVDLQVAVAGSESGRYGILEASGIFDPLLSLQGSDTYLKQPQAIRVFSSTSRSYVADLSLAQEIETGGIFTLGWTNEKQQQNSSFATYNPAYTSGLSLQFSQPLLRNFGRSTTLRLIRTARNQLEQNDQNFQQIVENTVQAVEQAYWNLVYARQNLLVQQEARDLAQELYRITKIQIDVGTQAPINIVQTEAGVAQQELAIIAARQTVGDAEDQLKRLLNFGAVGRWNDHIVPTDEVNVQTAKINLDEGEKEALENRPDVQSALFGAANAKISYEFTRNQALPQLNLNANYGYNGLGGNLIVTDANGNQVGIVPGGYSDALTQIRQGTFPNWSVGLNFSLPIGNRAARGARASARWQLISTLASLEQLKQNVIVNVRSAARAVETAEESIAAAEKNLNLAEQNLDAEKKKYDNGLVTSYEVLQIQNALSTARTALLQSRTQYRDAILAYHVSVGDVLQWKDIKIAGLANGKAPSLASLQAGR